MLMAGADLRLSMICTGSTLVWLITAPPVISQSTECMATDSRISLRTHLHLWWRWILDLNQ